MGLSEEIVITGLGLVSPIGIGSAPYWESLLRGRSGVAPLPQYEGTSLPVRFGAAVTDFEGKQFVRPRKSLKVMCREIQLGFSAATIAVEDAGLAEGHTDPDRFGVVYGSEMFYCEPDEPVNAIRKCLVDGEFQFDLWGHRAMHELYPLWMLMYLPNMVACHLGIAHDARGPNNTITVGEASSLLALIEAAEVIDRGAADMMIVGGVGSRINLTPLISRNDSQLSHRQDDPAAASRPFDADRDGMVNGEGASALVLERRAHAAARGAKIYGQLRGYGRSYQTRDQGQVSGNQGYRHAIRRALESSGLSAAELGHVNANGFSTPADDPWEAQALAELLPEVPVTCPRGNFGNLGAAAGLTELAASLLSFQQGQVPHILNYETPDPRCPIRAIRDEPLGGRPASALKLSQSSTGQTVALAVSGP